MKSFQAQTHYEVLEISVSASADEVKSAYARLSRLYADDQVVLYGMVDGGRAAALRARLREAFDVLADDARRDRYDVSLGLPPRELPPVRAVGPRASAPAAAAPAGGGGTFAWVTPSAPTPSAPSGPVAFTVPAPATVVSPPELPAVVSWVTAPSAPRQPAPVSAVAQTAALEVAAPAPADVSVPPPPPTAPPPVPLPPVTVERAPAPPPAPPPLDAASPGPSLAGQGEALVAEAPATVGPDAPDPVLLQAGEAPAPVLAPKPTLPAEAMVAVPASPAPAPPPSSPPAAAPSAGAAAAAVAAPDAPPEDDVPRLGEDVEVSITPLRTNSREFRLETRPKPYEVPPGVEFNGDLLRQVRMARGLSLAQLAERTRIGVKHLENVEGDRYDVLPAGVYLRGILMNLSRELGLDGLRVSKSYLTFVEAHRSKG